MGVGGFFFCKVVWYYFKGFLFLYGRLVWFIFSFAGLLGQLGANGTWGRVGLCFCHIFIY